MKNFSRVRLALGLASVALAFGGCASNPVYLHWAAEPIQVWPRPPPSPLLFPPSAAMRGDLGRVAVVAFAVAPPQVEVPASTSDLVIMAGRETAMAVTDGGAAGGEPVVAFVMLGAIAIGRITETVHALAVGEREERVAPAVAALSRAAAGLRPDTGLRERTLAAVRHAVPDVVLIGDFQPPVPDPKQGEIPAAGYAALARAGADTVMEIKIYNAGLAMDARTNRLRLAMQVRVRLLATRDGRELHYDYPEYAGAPRKLDAWTEWDARLVGEEAGHAFTVLAKEIATQIFTRPAGTLPDAKALAQSGLRRQPTGR